jgi:hypothetical protein
MRYKVNLSFSEFLTSSNPSWQGDKSYITDIGLYDAEIEHMDPDQRTFYSELLVSIINATDTFATDTYTNINDLIVNTQTNRIVTLATRLRFIDAQSVKNSVIYNIPQAINLDIQGQIPTLIRADFYTPAETDRIIQEYWADREGGII